MDTDDFTAKIVEVVIQVIVVQAVAVPIISGTITQDMKDDYPTLVTILTILPVFLALAIIMVVVKMFLDKRAGGF